jgi:hypothetical protein
MLPIARLRHDEVIRTVGVRRKRVLYGVWLVAASLLVMLAPGSRVNSHEQAPGSHLTSQEQNPCPPGFNDTPALSAHLDQADIASGNLSFAQIFRFGQQLFITNFNTCDGAGRPGRTAAAGSHGVGAARTPDPFGGPRFTVLSGPDSNSCASCHNEPGVGGAGSFHANLFEQAADCDPVAGVILSKSVFGLNGSRLCRPTPPTVSDGLFHTFNERGSLGLFGAGAIELLSREMTDDLQNLQAQAIAQAQAALHDVTVTLQTKGVQFGTLTAHANGTVDTSGVQGVSPDLVIRAFGRKGANKSIRHFSVQAFNRHLGMQPQEALEQLGASPPSDPDLDGVSNELTIGDITAAVVFQAALPVPRRAHLTGAAAAQAARGEQLFGQVGCAGCHVPALHLNSTVYCEPNPRNNDGDFRDTSQKFCFDLQKTSGLRGHSVAAYTDLKRHTICEPTKDYDPLTNHFCGDRPIALTPATDKTGPGTSGKTDNPPYHQFLTAKLWDTGNSGPWGDRNDIDTIYEAITFHGGEAKQSRTDFENLSNADQLAVVAFLKTLKMPIMLHNPQPQEIGSPRAHNPGGFFPLRDEEDEEGDED